MSNNILDFLTEATKEQSKLRLAISGPPGSGKTFSSINILMHMGCERIAVLDTEHGSVAKYSDEFPRKFQVVDNRYWKGNFDPRRLIVDLKTIGPNVDGVVVDSLTHFWMGPGGMLSLVDEFAKRAQARGGKYDSFSAWKQADPIYFELVQTILSLPCHFVACLRAKSEYEDQEINGRKQKVKVGMASQMRNDFEYEFDVEGMLDMSHNFMVGKTRCRALDGKIIPMPGANIAGPLLTWLSDGVPAVPRVETPQPTSETVKAAEATEGELEKEIAATTNKDELGLVVKKANKAKADGQISGEPWRRVSAAVTAKMKELAAGAAA